MADDGQIQTSMQTAPVEQPGITPVSQPTMMRYRPPSLGDDGQGNLMALARSLSSMDASLGTLVDQQQQQADQYDKVRAQSDFIKNNSEGYATAVQQGKIPAYASPAYVSAYKQTEGAVAGNDLQQKFNAAYDAWGGKNSDDPNAYSQFAQGFLAQNLNTNDKDVLTGLMPHVNQMIQQGQARYIQDKHNATVAGSINANTAVMDNSLVTMRNQAQENGQPLNLDAGWSTLMNQRNSYLKSGGTATQIDNKIIDTITSQAIQARGMGGPEILTMLDRNVPGTNYTYAETPYGQAQKQQTLSTLENMGRRAIAENKVKLDAANKAELGDVTTRTLTSLAANPNQPVPDSLIQEGSKAGLDPQFRVHVAQWQDTLRKNLGTSDPQDILALNWSIINGDHDAIGNAMQNGKIHTAGELRDALALQAKTSKAQDVMSPIMKSGQVTQLIAAIKDRTLAKGDITQMFAPGGMTNAGLGLTYSLHNQIQDWAIAHPNATEQDRYNAIAAIGKSVLDTINTTGGTPTVTMQPGAPANPYLQAGQNTLSGQPVPPSPAPNAVNPQAQAPAASNVTPRDQAVRQQIGAPGTPNQPTAAISDPVVVNGWLKSLPPMTQTRLAAHAQQRGEPLEAVAARAYAASKQSPMGQSASPPTQGQGAPQVPADMGTQLHQALSNWKETDPNSPAVMHQLQTSFLSALHSTGQSGSYTLAAIKDNPKAAHILDFVAGPESHGNYNAYFGHTNSSEDLSRMTVNQVLQWQKQRTDSGSPSSATGRYQLTHDTLGNLKTQLGLTGNEKFTPQMQDTLALQLLKNRGYDRWRTGQMSDTTFANNLAKEWASLPDVHTGRSHYEGDGLNHALVSPRQVSDTLASTRAIQEKD